MAVGTWSSCLWTGKAIKKYSGQSDISMTLKYTSDNVIIPAMPAQLCTVESVGLVIKLFLTQTVDIHYHQIAMVSEFKVNTVPLKPMPENVRKNKWKNYLSSQADSLSLVHPVGLLPQNIGSNIGLGRIMRDHYTDQGQDCPGQCLQYTAFNADIDIFNRVIKVACVMWLSTKFNIPTYHRQTQQIFLVEKKSFFFNV